MTAPKVGDRVRVEFEGVVLLVGLEDIEIKVEDRTRFVSRDFFDAHGTVTAPAVNVGDVATLDVLNSLPHGSVVIAKGGLVAQLYVDKGGRNWRIPGQSYAMSPSTLAYWSATVLHIGGSK